MKKPKKLESIDYRDIIAHKLEKIENLEEKEAEYKKFYSKLSLAQRRGLVAQPAAPLTVDEWKKVVEKAKERVKNETTCPICMDDFKLKPQLVLSCSHYFHQECLESFEKHSGVKRCPVCRSE